MNRIMSRIFSIFMFTILALQFGFSQEETNGVDEEAVVASQNLTYEANQELRANDFISAEVDYRKAISKNPENVAAPYNLGRAYYNRESFGEAFSRFKQAGESASDKSDKHRAYHNMGNVYMKNKEYEKAVEAYKEALRNNPNDEETRYNLALAKELLKKQQDEQKNDQNQDDQKEQDQDEQQDQNQDQNNEGENDKNDEGEQNDEQNKDEGDDGDKGNDKPEENKEGDGDKKKEQEQKPNEGDQPERKKQPRPNQLSKQQIQNLLEAMQNEEKKVQEKLEAKKVKGAKVKNEKDWWWNHAV